MYVDKTLCDNSVHMVGAKVISNLFVSVMLIVFVFTHLGQFRSVTCSDWCQILYTLRK